MDVVLCDHDRRRYSGDCWKRRFVYVVWRYVVITHDVCLHGSKQSIRSVYPSLHYLSGHMAYISNQTIEPVFLIRSDFDGSMKIGAPFFVFLVYIHPFDFSHITVIQEENSKCGTLKKYIW